MQFRLPRSVAVFGAIALLASACAPAAPPASPTTAPTAAPAKPTSAPAAAPTAAPAPVGTAASTPAGSAASAGAISYPPKPAQPIKVSAGIVGAIDQLGTPVAKDKGFFEKWGLDVTVANPYATGVDLLNALQAGDIQVGQVGVPMIGAALKGMDLVVLGAYNGSAARRGSDATMALVTKDGSGINSVADVKGKRIAVSFGTINHLYMLALLQKAGLKPTDVTLVNTPPAEMPVALQGGGVDAFANWDPFPIIATQTVPGARIVQRGGEVIGFLGYVVAMRDWADKNPDVVNRLLGARAEADQWMRQNPGDTAQIATRWLPGTALPIAQEAMKYETQLLDIRLSDYNARAFYEGESTLKNLDVITGIVDPNKVFKADAINKLVQDSPGLFSDLAPIPPEAQIKPGYQFKP